MVGEIDDRGLVGGRLGLPDQFVGVRQPIGHRRLERAGITLFAVLAGVGQRDAARARLVHGFAMPQDLVESLDPAMQMAGDSARSVIGGERILLAIERKLAVRDAVAKAADSGSKVAGAAQPAGQRIVAQGDIGGLARAVRHFDCDQDRTILGDLRRHALGVDQREDLHFPAVV